MELSTSVTTMAVTNGRTYYLSFGEKSKSVLNEEMKKMICFLKSVVYRVGEGTF